MAAKNQSPFRDDAACSDAWNKLFPRRVNNIENRETGMDWKLDRQRREKKQALAKREAVRSVNLMDEMEREFTQIFGDGKSAEFSSSPSKMKDSIGTARVPRPCKAPRPDWATDPD